MVADYCIEHARWREGRVQQEGLRLGTVTDDRTLWRLFPHQVNPAAARHVLDRYGSPEKIPGMKSLRGDERDYAIRTMAQIARRQPAKGDVEEEEEEEEGMEEGEEEEEEEEEEERPRGAALRGTKGRPAEETRAKLIAAGKKGQAVRKAKAEGRPYREGEEFEMFGEGPGRGAQRHSAEDIKRRVSYGGRKGQAALRAKYQGRPYREGEEDEGREEEEEEDELMSEEEKAEDTRARLSAAGKKGQAVRRAKAEGRPYREGEEFEMFGQELKGAASRHGAQDIRRRVSEGGKKGSAHRWGRPYGREEEQEAGDYYYDPHPGVGQETHAKLAHAGRKGQAVLKAKAQGRQYREGEEEEEDGEEEEQGYRGRGGKRMRA